MWVNSGNVGLYLITDFYRLSLQTFWELEVLSTDCDTGTVHSEWLEFALKCFFEQMWNKWTFLLHPDWTPPDAALLGDPHSPVSSRAPKFTHHQVLLQYNLLLRNSQHVTCNNIGLLCHALMAGLNFICPQVWTFSIKSQKLWFNRDGNSVESLFSGGGWIPNHTWYS